MLVQTNQHISLTDKQKEAQPFN